MLSLAVLSLTVVIIMVGHANNLSFFLVIVVNEIYVAHIQNHSINP